MVDAGVNGADGEATDAFLNRPVSASDWQVTISAGAPEAGSRDMDLLKLTDIELKFSTTRATRAPGEKDPGHPDCVRTDFRKIRGDSRARFGCHPTRRAS